ncbi:MAG TPA: hemolysin family protein [Permianibacter sp.]|nr:hemolysin family protein [Permianibacter sp.]
MGTAAMDLLIILFLILLNGVFAMSEIAVVSSRKVRLQQRAEAGSHGAAAALKLANEPGHFLSTIQVGITTIGIFSGAFGEATLAAPLEAWLLQFPLLADYARPVAVVLVVMLITYLSVVLGELVPKRLALHNPEGLATIFARPLNALGRIASPLVALFSKSSELLLRLLGSKPDSDAPVTDEEIKVLMQQGTEAGVFESSEGQLVANVLRMDDLNLNQIMTPRIDVSVIDVADSPEQIRDQILACNYSRLVVCRDGLDQVIGVVYAKDLLNQLLSGKTLDVQADMRTPLYVPETVAPMQLMSLFKRHRETFALVVDEYGDVQGVVTLADIMEAIVGDLPSEDAADDADIVRREDGSLLVDGLLAIDRLKEVLKLSELPDEESGDYHTVSGFVMTVLGRLPKTADHFDWQGYRFEVVDMDRNRVDKVLVVPPPAARQPE